MIWARPFAVLPGWMKRERLEVADAKRLQALETENAKLKKMLAEQMMNVATLKEMKARHYCA
ncbi:hypothetical protein [Roseivivax sp. THAF30]|uniref:hypothetical protein n=1 Tax=Roseivivax sp. THAF30 TaxID=2587852 RepID=UPI00156225E1